MSSRRRKKNGHFAWYTALAFNGLIVAFAYLLLQLIGENRAAMGEEYIRSSEAVTATREKMSQMFADLVPDGQDPRTYWSGEVNKFLRDDDLTSARGMLMAAPDMLNKRDVGAVMAAAEAEKNGTLDDRLLRAATLFLPDDVRAKYERATAPTAVQTLTTPDESSEDTVADVSDSEAEPEATETPDTAPETTSGTSFFVLGNERDLAYQSAGWLRGDRTDVFNLSISGIGLAAQQGRFEGITLTDDALRGASLVKSARRAGRLQPAFSHSLENRLSAALPQNELKKELQRAYGEGSSLLIQGDAILDAFVRATDENKLRPFLSQLERISQLQSDNPNSAALTLLETISGQRDLKRAELITVAGGDRAITLSHYYGADVLDAAQTVMDWTLRLILLIMASVAVMTLLFWLSLSTFFRSFNRSDSLGTHYGY